MGLLVRMCQLLPPVNAIDILEDYFGVDLISDWSTSGTTIRYILEELSVFAVSLIASILCGNGADIGSWYLRLRGFMNAPVFIMN